MLDVFLESCYDVFVAGTTPANNLNRKGEINMTNTNNRMTQILGTTEARFHFESKYTADRDIVIDGTLEHVVNTYGALSQEEAAEVVSRVAYLLDHKR